MKDYQFTKDQLSLIERMRQPFAVYQFLDKRVVTLALSDGFCELFGYDDRAEAYHDMDHNMFKDTHPDDAARVAGALLRFAAEGGRLELIFRTRKKEGGYRVIHLQGEQLTMEDESRVSNIWFMEEGDYGEGKGSALNEALNNALHDESFIRANHYDALTGLPNMAYFCGLAEEAEKLVEQRGGRPTLLYLNLRGMKFFNTRYGFAEGDKMLRAFSDLLSCLYLTENCCHIGADHFAVFTEEKGLEESLQQLFEEWEATETRMTLPVHVGIYLSQYEGLRMSAACDRAKLACDALRGTYNSSFNYYRNALNEGYVRQQYILENFDRALSEKWIQLYLQPIIRTVNGRVCDVEALARWQDPEKGMLSPAEFIPALENAGLIYRLDLYMLDRTLEAIRERKEAGFPVLPHSINLSRSDFIACDIVEEFRRRVDAAGVDRDRITVEITESVIGSDFEFMKEQVEKFQRLGFPVWMDDFGSGYSSLDVLQSIRFDLIKFDMSFLRKLDQGDSAKVILTELMRMATALGVDTVCEGVETESQIRFLQEIGCSKLQGYYYSRPVPFDTVLEMSKSGTLIENENPEESEYYESIGRVNLFDLGVISGGDENALQNIFSTMPIAILEVKDDKARYVRSNRSYQEFIKRFFHVDMWKDLSDYGASPIGYGSAFISAVKRCRDTGNRVFFDEKMPDGSLVHSFVRRVSVNPVTGSAAVAIAVLSIREDTLVRQQEAEKKLRQEMVALGRIAALSENYIVLYTVDPVTGHYTQYDPSGGFEDFGLATQGEDFFADVVLDAPKAIHPEDMDRHLRVLTKENMLREIRKKGFFLHNYRLIMQGEPVPVSLRATLAREEDGDKIILGVSRV